MIREYFDYDFEDGEEIFELNGNFYYVVTGSSLRQIKEKVRDAIFRSTIVEAWGEDEGDWYRPNKLVGVFRNCDGTWTAVFLLELNC